MKEAPQTTNSNRKRKADVLGRVQASSAITKAGFTLCPLCPQSRKKFALGRGIATHLHAVHSPWNPGKAERKKRERLRKRREAERKRVKSQERESGDENDEEFRITSWNPTDQERLAWDQRVLEILKDLESRVEETSTETPREDRNGNALPEYRNSLPPFIEAAANGDLPTLQNMVVTAKDTSEEAIVELLNTRDRHMSLAEHWAAGGGHLECLKYLLDLRKIHVQTENPKKKMRRRDGKTCLHYAARNGRLQCLRYLIEDQNMNVNERSGDGTTPFHLALFGCHLDAAKYLIEQGAEVKTKNDWKCGPAHWLALSKEPSQDLNELCSLLMRHGVSFTEIQSQGHTPLHKAAQKLNRPFLKWVLTSPSIDKSLLTEASAPDQGGHTPVDIWLSFGGDADFADWMRQELARSDEEVVALS